MSHFTVLVVLDKNTPLEGVDARLAEVLEPWNENTQVEPYKSYEEGQPENHWGYAKAYEDALPAADAPPVTWEAYVPAFNARFGDEPLEYDAEVGRAYTWSTYNPLSKWDWWQVGGRWSNALLAKTSVDLSALLWSPSHWTEEHGNTIPKGRDEAGHYHCNGGRLMDLDLEAMLAAKIAKSTADYDAFLAAITPELLAVTKPWSHFYELEQAGEYAEEAARLNGLLGATDDREKIHARALARKAYNEQPGIVRLNEDETYRRWFSCPVEHFKLGREEYIAREGANFLPGYAMVTLDGQWIASGDMGWWGMGSDTEGTVDAFKSEMGAYLRDGVDQESIVVLVDCHI